MRQFIMMKKTKLAQAVSIAIAGTALSLGAISDASAATTTMYNLSTGLDGTTINTTSTPDPTTGGTWAFWGGVTDGWSNGANTGGGTGIAAAQNWAGTSSSTTAAFGYNGAHLNWGLEFTGNTNNVAEISTFDSKARYNIYADIDTAKGAWSATNTGATFGGWRHDLDVGLFKTDKNGLVTLSIEGILKPGTTDNYGFTIFQGVDSVTSYNHHGGWNANNNAQPGAPLAASVFGGSLAGTALNASQVVAYSVGSIAAYGSLPPQNLNTISFNATAGQIYTIALGGYRNGDWTTTVDGYKLTVSQVPVPGAVWLFGSAMAGLIGFGRRNKRVA
ncbi:MAG: hypothetical protein HOO92_06300 [Methylococcaceae bacterium]|nr:hypothetical protein [Methylococcaceae bacterium]